MVTAKQKIATVRDGGRVRSTVEKEGNSYWQPMPANGFVRCLLDSGSLGSTAQFAMGTQTLPPGGSFVREHSHDANEEVIFFVAGKGVAVLDDIEHAVEPGVVVYLGLDCRHKFINNSTEDLSWAWFFMPGGLETFFESIGRPRGEGEPTPQPFPRPANVTEIEARTVFATGEARKRDTQA